MNAEKGRIRSLDGLRAISIALVMVSHLVGTRGFLVPESVGRVFELGELGVRVFFVISGFLITSILLKELERNQTINLPKFYFRRTLRIFPPYYLFLLVLVLIGAKGLIALNPGDLAHALTYTSNYHNDRSWLVGHTWSLAVEEQFYILWPAVLLLLGKRKGLLLAAACLLAAPLIRVGIWEAFPDIRAGIGQRFETVADSIAAGCLLAGIRPRLHSWSVYRKLLGSAGVIVAVVILMAGNAVHDHPLVHFFLGYTLMNLGIAFCVDWCVTNHSGRVGRVLNLEPIVMLGVMSYSVYLWQQVFLDRYSQSTPCRFPINIVLVAIASALSYFLCEKPCFALRRWLEARVFRGQGDGGPEPADKATARQVASEVSLQNIASVGMPVSLLDASLHASPEESQ